MTTEPLVVIGIGHDGPAGLSPEALDHIARAEVLAGGARHLAFFPDWQGEKIVLNADLTQRTALLQQSAQRRKTVVLASGDPLYYGIGRLLLETFPREQLLFLPHLSSVQLAFARIKETWDDACIVSLHGRPLQSLAAALHRREDKIAVFTDARNSPAAIGAFLRETGCAEAYHIIWVCENLGGPDERVSPWTPRELESQLEIFSPLNIVILLRMNRPLARGISSLPLLGIPEDALRHRTRRGNLITKREIRLLSLCYLELHPGEVLWDVGAGSGSVAIEAACLHPAMKIFAIEKGAEAYANLEANVRVFGTSGVHAVAGTAPDVFASLPDPDAVFVGGSGGSLEAILAAALQRLKPQGRLVVNCITLDNLARGWQWLRDRGAQPQATSVQLAHSRPLGDLHCLEPSSPLFILQARKR
ncbi:MAG TPA: precorrin-6y C5,15-methyltransferase (decarboxylating) subunit CbiE [Gemmataceae bacterium]|nr:precorrin-6y C5,15-methyltransferase (decarboxylating) subunit CbiE [Gemmataceae bacterium]